ncbi:hypothetical protein V6N12_040534 [Hibiscus sabdariffa]|uniref:Uncharacterized protein n=1 Tax=Hibiscus sabdariffa TaxID=183260 RepID=A0ABR2E411_9ROSI
MEISGGDDAKQSPREDKRAGGLKAAVFVDGRAGEHGVCGECGEPGDLLCGVHELWVDEIFQHAYNLHGDIIHSCTLGWSRC